MEMQQAFFAPVFVCSLSLLLLMGFPKDKNGRKKWEVALRKEGFTASDSSVLCCEDFKQGNFDRTGQIVRLRDGVIPSIFSFPVHLQIPEKGRTTSTSGRAEESLSMAFQDAPETATSHPQPQPNDDHGYALPASPTALKTRLNEALARVKSLEREKKNDMAREKRENNLINEEFKERLEFYSALQIDFMKKQGHKYTKDYREFALTLHLHGPKAYKYLRENIFLSHIHIQLQRWLRSVGETQFGIVNHHSNLLGCPTLPNSPLLTCRKGARMKKLFKTVFQGF